MDAKQYIEGSWSYENLQSYSDAEQQHQDIMSLTWAVRAVAQALIERNEEEEND